MRDRGFSLVELLVALALSVFLLTALLQSYAATASARRNQDSVARLVESGRTAVELVARSARMARYWGCMGSDPDTITVHDDLSIPADGTGDQRGLSTKGLFGVEGAGDNPDELITWRAEDNRATTLTGNVALSTTLNLSLAANPSLSASDWVSLSNCAQTDVFRLSAVSGNTASFTRSGPTATCATCTRSYASGALVQRVLRQRFFIGTGAADRPALFVENNGVAQELLPGVEDMQVTYGIDTDGDGVVNQYVGAGAVTGLCAPPAGNDQCWTKVATVRIALLVASEEDGTAAGNQSYFFNGQARTGTDRRVRREFLGVVSVRNYRS